MEQELIKSQTSSEFRSANHLFITSQNNKNKNNPVLMHRYLVSTNPYELQASGGPGGGNKI